MSESANLLFIQNLNLNSSYLSLVFLPIKITLKRFLEGFLVRLSMFCLHTIESCHINSTHKSYQTQIGKPQHYFEMGLCVF